MSVQIHYKSTVLVIEEGCGFLSLTFSVIYGQFNKITGASWHIQPTRLITFKDLGLSAASEREEHRCQNLNEKSLLEGPQKNHGCKMGLEGI